MSKRAKKAQTIPLSVPDGVQPTRRVIAAGEAAVAAWHRRRAEAKAQADAIAAEVALAEEAATARALLSAERAAKRQGVAVERDTPRGPIIAARDGLLWLSRKGKLHPAHERAGLRFRKDYERALSDGLGSSLGMQGGGSYGPKSGTTSEQLVARDAVNAALAALPSPMLRPYVEQVAGRGEMLNSKIFCEDERRVGDHFLPCVIALDCLARHYGMIR